MKVKVTPKSGRGELVGFLADGTLKVNLLAAPERGRANEELRAPLTKRPGVCPHQVEIVGGEVSPPKHVRVSAT